MKIKELIELGITAKECNRDLYIELTVPTREETEIIIIKNDNIDYKLDYYCKNYTEDLELIRCKDIKILKAEIVMWGSMLATYKINFDFSPLLSLYDL